MPAWLAWLACIAWAASMAGAGYTKDKVLRPLLLLASLFGVIGCIGAGDPSMAVSAGLSVAFAAVLSTVFAPEERRALKISLTGFVGALLAVIGIELVWNMTFPRVEVPGALSVAGYIVAGALVIAAGAVTMRRRLLSPGSGIVMTALFVSAAMYPGISISSPSVAWRLRISGFSGYVHRLVEPGLYASLSAYRPTRAEAAERRLPRAENGTDIKLLPALLARTETKDPLLHAWLSADNALYASKIPGAKPASREEPLALLKNLPSTGPVEEMRGWVLLEANRPDEALKAFERVVQADPNTMMAHLGAGLAASKTGDKNLASDRLTTWCLSDPRALFSPAWDRDPLATLRPAVIAKWKAVANSPEGKKLTRYLNWYEAWERADGDMRKFLEDPKNNAPVTGAIRVIRERMLETLRRRDDAKIGSIFSASVALLTDRHVNLGQCHALYAACAGGDIARATQERVLISRPTMPGWCGPTEGGAGASLHDLEENLLVRLVTYGAESPQP